MALKRQSVMSGDIVRTADPAALRRSWLLAIIILQTYPDRKGLVRSARVQTKASILDRPVTKHCLLQEVSAGG